MGAYHLRLDDWNVYMHGVFDQLCELEPHIQCTYDRSTDNSYTVRDVLHPYGSRLYTPFEVFIGVKSLINNIQDGYVRDEDAVKTLAAAFHEQKHVHLATTEYRLRDVSEDIRQMARVSVASSYLPEYDKFGYCRNPEEIACELYTFEQMEKFFDEHPVGFDWQQILLDRANIQHDFILRADSFEDLKNQYAAKIVSSYYDGRINVNVLQLDRLSPAMEKLLKSGVGYDLLNAENGVEEIKILNTYIAEYHPEYFRGYQCIKDEYKVTSLISRYEDAVQMLLGIKPLEAYDDMELS